MLRDGWKQVRRIKLVLTYNYLKKKLIFILLKGDTRQIGPIGNRCGGHLVECRIDKIHIDSTLVRKTLKTKTVKNYYLFFNFQIRFIAEHFFALKHLDFRHCELDDANALESFRDLGARLRSLNLTKMVGLFESNQP